MTIWISCVKVSASRHMARGIRWSSIRCSGYEMFDSMTAAIREDTVRILFHIRVEQKVEREPAAKVTGTNKDDTAVNAPKKREAKKIYPNDPCPCGSGKKFKQCCGRKILQEMNSNPELKNTTVAVQSLPQGGKKEEK